MDQSDETVAPNEAAAVFDEKFAGSYDKQLDKVGAIKDAMHLAIMIVLSNVPKNARILCVGAGTGDELIYLARIFSDWHFTVVEPAPAMMVQCQAKIQQLGITSRCSFHEGYLDSLPASEPFDAATSILVSQFCTEIEKRRQFFWGISSRLRDGGVIVTADLSADVSGPTFDGLLDAWMRNMKYAGDTPELQEQRRSMFYSSDILRIAPQHEVEEVIKNGGFDAPVLIYQYMAILMWYARKAKSS